MTQSPASPRPWTGADVRKTFLDFFEEHRHSVQPSSALVPGNDPTLLFTNAGMVQFKDVFLGMDQRPYSRAATSQKCMRVSGKHNDLENVGPSPRHHTFFEMLGNFSFGDYFKRDAIRFAHQLILQVYQLDPARVYFTVHRDDDEAYQLWLNEVGVPPERIAKLGDSTNFWQMADTGPCGYTAEIHYDMWDNAPMPTPEELVVQLDENPDNRFLEIWNLVFMQFNQKPDGTREPLPAPGVDTGMGLERITMVLQHVDNSYDTDLFSPIMDRIQQVAGHTAQQRADHLIAYRVIADHTRAATFMITDGVTPGNESRNYVCRMVIRRAARFAQKMGLTEPFMARVADAVIAHFRAQYPELDRARTAVEKTLTEEETRFARTVDVGVANLQESVKAMQAAGQTTLDGETAFRLYATHGLPVEITRDILQEFNLNVDEAGFRAAMDEHRKVSGKGEAMGEMGGESVEFFRTLLDDLKASGRLPAEGVSQQHYGPLELESRVLALIVNGQPADSATPGDRVEVILAATSFYVESGGQVSDTGSIAHYKGHRDTALWEIRVDDVRKPIGGLVVHVGEVLDGTPRVSDPAWALVDDQHRWDIMRNHTATHLLHAELRYILGDHARQAGSLVAPDRLRFDFTHGHLVTADELTAITERVNNDILTNYPVRVETKSREAAIGDGAMALFGEKYGDIVRTIQIGEPTTFSYELCGGTHVPETADIGPFVIVSEGAVAAGVRRIEALTGRAAQDYISQRLAQLSQVAALLNAPIDDVERKLTALLDARAAQDKQLAALQRELALQQADQLLAQVQTIAGVPVLTAQVTVPDAATLRDLTDWFRGKHPTGVAVLAAQTAPDAASLVAIVTKDLTARGLKAGDLISAITPLVDGRGGGKPELAQGGGKNPAAIPAALQAARDRIAQILGA